MAKYIRCKAKKKQVLLHTLIELQDIRLKEPDN